MSNKPGIVDPWRIVEPLQPAPARPKNGRINLSDQDADADLRPTQTGYIDSKHGSIEVRGKDVTDMGDVLKHIVGCLFDLQQAYPEGLKDAAVAFRRDTLRSRAWEDITSPGWSTAEEYVPDCELRFKRQTLDGGMLRLIRALRELQRHPGVPAILAKWGVRITLR